MLETVASVLVFTLTVVSVSLAAAAALRTQRTSLVERQGVETLFAMVEQATGVGYVSLLDDSFTVPEPCPDTPSGIGGTSCVEVLGEDVVVSWSTTLASDPLGWATTASSSLELTASATMSGRQVTASRVVNAPTFGFDHNTGLLRITATPTPPAGTSVFVLSDSEPRTVVDAATFSTSGTALFRLDPSSCTVGEPCVVSLDPDAVAPVDGWFLDGSPASRGVSIIEGALVQLPMTMRSVSTLDVLLIAENQSGEVAWNTTEGSVCMWVTFRDAGGVRHAPGCNSDRSERITLSTYRSDPSREDRHPIPLMVPLEFSIDHPNGDCPQVDGMVAFNNGTWGEGAVCTSWSWGHPATLSVDGQNIADGTPFTLTDQVTYGELRWVGANAYPATGYSGEPLWVTPRSAGECATTGDCTPAPIPAPETTLCPGEHCLSSANSAPYATVGVLTAAPRTVLIDGPTTSFTVTIDDLDDDQVTAVVATVPASMSGELRSGDPATVVVADDVLLSNVTAGSQIAFEYVRGSVGENGNFSLRLSDTAGNVTMVEFALVSSHSLSVATAAPLTVEQYTTGALDIVGWDTDGDASDDTVSFDYPAGMTGPSTATFTAGELTVNVAVTDTTPGARTVLMTSTSGRVIPLTVEVVAAPASIDMTVTNIDQGAQGLVSVEVVDGDDLQVAGRLVRLSLSGPQGTTVGLRLTPTACRTDAAGVCSVLVLTEDAAPLGTYSVTASTGEVTTTASASIVAALATFDTGPVEVSQGGSVEMTITSRDGTGAVFPQAAFIISAPSGLTVTPSSGVTSLAGQVTVTIAPASTMVQGLATLTVAGGGVESFIVVSVTPAPATFTAQAVTVAAGSSGELLVTVLDANGTPAPGVTVTVTATTIRTVPNATSSTSGVIAIPVAVPKGVASGSYQVTVTAGSLVSTFEVTVP